MTSVDSQVNQVIDILSHSVDQAYIGEAISQLEHALQAAYFAQKAQASEEAILAALFHDLGHICAPQDAPRMEALGVVKHEKIGGAYLRELGFSPSIAELVEAHVDAKRYLTHKNPRYLANLSTASTGTLQFQGGPMSEEEAAHFETDPLFNAKLALRQWDEMAKVVDLKVPELATYRDMMKRHCHSPLVTDHASTTHGHCPIEILYC